MYINNQEDLCEGKFIDKDIDKIVFGPNIKSIPENCFNGCNNLKEIVFEGNINNIEPAAFMNCNNLQIINANNINVVKDFAFYNCNLYQINLSEKQINKIKFGTYNDILSKYYILPEKDTLENTSWKDINNIAKKGKIKEYFKIGDTKTIKINLKDSVKNVKVEILDFEHDCLSHSFKTANITFGLAECIEEVGYYDSGILDSYFWNSCAVREYLNNDIFNSLENELSSIIKIIRKESYNYDGQCCVSYNNLFLFSETEVFGSNEKSRGEEGYQYVWFKNPENRLKKRNTYSDWWWLRSLSHKDTKFDHCSVSMRGEPMLLDTSEKASLIFGFCI